MINKFRRIAIVNRGEPAMRFIHGVKEYNLQYNEDITTIAFYTDIDNNAMYVREADEAVSIGSPVYYDEKEDANKVSYLNYERLSKALRESQAEAVWVGWGFVAEDPDFADLCKEMNIVFIGPDGETMRKLGDKITAKMIAEKAGIDVIPWSGGILSSLEEARIKASELGYPLMIKATAGGGGRGIRKVRDEASLHDAYESASTEALKAFGDGTVFLEKQIKPARHIEVQMIADHYGTVWPLGVRDCTLQRRNQKVLEESPSPVLTEDQEAEVKEYARQLCAAIGYHNAGTVEFLYDPLQQRFHFMEVNARLQVEHPVTEMTSGIDLIKHQIHVARGGRLEGEMPLATGHAIEVRLNAEDPSAKFMPAPGEVELFKLCTGPGLRVDTGVVAGDSIPPQFDSMIAKIIAYGKDRPEAMARLQRALEETSVIISGGTSNKGFLLNLLRRKEIQASDYDTGWLDELVESGGHRIDEYAGIALVQVAIEEYLAELELEKYKFYSSAYRGRPEVREESGFSIELKYNDQIYLLNVLCLDPSLYRLEVDGHELIVRAQSLNKNNWKLRLADKNYHVFTAAQGDPHTIEVDGVPYRIHKHEGGIVHAPSPAVVSSIHVSENDEVLAGERLLVLEAMKMEMSITASYSGIVREVLVTRNMQVDTGQALMMIEASGDDAAGQSDRVDFSGFTEREPVNGSPHKAAVENLNQLYNLIKGYDADPAFIRKAIADYTTSVGCSASEPAICNRERDILQAFTDIISLFRRDPISDAVNESQLFSSVKYLYDYLLDIRSGNELIPGEFLGKLSNALDHYGVTSLDPGPELESVLFRIFKSFKRMASQLGIVTGILEKRLEERTELDPETKASFGRLLDRLITEAHGRFHNIFDLAREVRYVYFDQPLIQHVKDDIYRSVRDHLTFISENPGDPSIEERIEELVACPQPIKGILSNFFVDAGEDLRQVILKTLTLRYYRIRKMDNLRLREIGGCPVLSTEYEYEGKHIHLFTTHSEYTHLKETAEKVCQLIGKIPADHDIIMDFYLRHPVGFVQDDELSQEISKTLGQVGFLRSVRRIVTSSSGPTEVVGSSGVKIFTFRHTDNGFQEERSYRGLHPMLAKRLEIWRLANFELEPVPSVEDVFLFRGTAKNNSRDIRMFAITEVRHSSMSGKHAAGENDMPYLKMMLSESLVSILNYQATLPVRQRPYLNRILLFIRPVVKLKKGKLGALIRQLNPLTQGLGMEKIIIHAKIVSKKRPEPENTTIEVSNHPKFGLTIDYRPTDDAIIQPMTSYEQKAVKADRRGLHYPYDIVKMLTADSNSKHLGLPKGSFTEYDLDDDNQLVEVDRPYGLNSSNIIIGLITNYTKKYPEGLKRVTIMNDPTKDMGSLAEAECRRINAAIELAEQMEVPVEWFAVSAGARISMQSGVENMDWVALVLRKIIRFTQAGGEMNIIVTGVNVGAQSYWNGEATMLMHTKGILIMLADTSMLLTGKQALDFSGGISAEDNQGIGGYERIMGPNGQAQYYAADISQACTILLHHYELTYKVPEEDHPRKAKTNDPVDRDICQYALHDGSRKIGEIFSSETNPERKMPFDMRSVMSATIDQDHEPLERWKDMHEAEIGIVWDAHLGGYPVCFIGIESRPLKRLGVIPADGPLTWTGGTLFPFASKKVARAINAASNNRPVVMLLNLSGFDGSPESMRNWQLEFGSEIGRAVVNFEGPIILCVVSRYHGGAFVVFSNKLNDNMEVAALEGTYASVIGGAPAAAVVFARDVAKRTRSDERIVQLDAQIAEATGALKSKLNTQRQHLYQEVYSEKLGEVAGEFDNIHNVERAKDVGAVDKIIPARGMRPYLVRAVEKGLAKVNAHREAP
jgi:acetyl/propionyl-CoA carboxylase alpha subunit/acetyl-CoA carboxylase carboxyltransferase component